MDAIDAMHRCVPDRSGYPGANQSRQAPDFANAVAIDSTLHLFEVSIH